MADIEPEHTPIYPVKKRLSGQYEGLAINTVTSCTLHYAIKQSDPFLANLNATRPALECPTLNIARSIKLSNICVRSSLDSSHETPNLLIRFPFANALL